MLGNARCPFRKQVSADSTLIPSSGIHDGRHVTCPRSDRTLNFADTAYGSGRNAFEASRRGTELVSPVAGSAPGNCERGLTTALCKASHPNKSLPISALPLRYAGAYVLKADLVKVNIERRRRAEAPRSGANDIRAGIEGTNSELKLLWAPGRRVRLTVYLKALACNFKRMVHARLVEMEDTAQRAVGTVPVAVAAGLQRATEPVVSSASAHLQALLRMCRDVNFNIFAGIIPSAVGVRVPAMQGRPK